MCVCVCVCVCVYLCVCTASIRLFIKYVHVMLQTWFLAHLTHVYMVVGVMTLHKASNADALEIMKDGFALVCMMNFSKCI